MGGWWRWALVSPDGVSPSRMVNVSAFVNLPLHHKVQKFSSGSGSPGWSWKKGRKTVVWWWWIVSRKTLNRRNGQSPRGQRRTVSLTGQVTKDVGSQLTFRGSYCSRSFGNGRDFVPYLGWTVDEGKLTELCIHVWDLKKSLVGKSAGYKRAGMEAECWPSRTTFGHMEFFAPVSA